MSTLLRILLITSLIFIAALVILRPTQVRSLGAKARLIGYLYVIAILVGAVTQLAGWRT